MPVSGAISAELSGRRRGCRAVESRVSCRCPALARAFRGRSQEAGTARHRSGPICRQAVQPAARWSFPPEPPCRNAAPDASGRNWRRVQAMAARFGPGASSGQAEPVRPPHWRPPSTPMREAVRVLYPCGKTACARGGSARRERSRSIFRRDWRTRNSWSPPIRLLAALLRLSLAVEAPENSASR